MQSLRASERIECEGFEDLPALRGQLLAYVENYCAKMTLAQAREWFEDSFLKSP